MAFNVGREFNKFASTQGAGFFGALPEANKKRGDSLCGWNALQNIGRYKAAELGVQAQAAEQAANRRNSLTTTLIGAGGNMLGTGLSAGITHGFNFGGGGGGFSAGDAQAMGCRLGRRMSSAEVGPLIGTPICLTTPGSIWAQAEVMRKVKILTVSIPRAGKKNGIFTRSGRVFLADVKRAGRRQRIL